MSSGSVNIPISSLGITTDLYRKDKRIENGIRNWAVAYKLKIRSSPLVTRLGVKLLPTRVVNGSGLNSSQLNNNDSIELSI